MNLIRHHQHAVPAAYLQQAAQLFLRPYAAHRVVRVAQNVQGYTLLHNLLFHGLEVEGVVHAGALQFVFHKAALFAGLHRAHEGIVNRCGYHHTGTGPGERAHGPIQRGHHARRHAHPLGLHGKAVALRLPAHHRVKIRGRRGKIAQRALDVLVQRLFYAGGAGKIHVCHPHGQQAVLPKFLRQSVPLFTLCAAPVHIFHSSMPPCRFVRVPFGRLRPNCFAPSIEALLWFVNWPVCKKAVWPAF